MKKQKNVWYLVFALIVIIELLGRLINDVRFEYPVKPLIMVMLAVYYLRYAKDKRARTPILLAFFFSWLGDMFLMFSGGYDSASFFYAGVGGFFLAQLSYIFIFLKYRKNAIKGFLLRRPWWAIPFIAVLVYLYALLLPNLEGIMKPIILLYAISLFGMSMAALNRLDRASIRSFNFVFIGSLFFLISDSMIAINKFHSTIPEAGFLIMLSYITAQYLITRGLCED